MSFQPSSSPGWTSAWPCGRIAGRAKPLRASRLDVREAKGRVSLIIAPSVLDHAAAEAGRGPRRRRTRHLAGRREYRAAEILFEPVGNVGPERLHLLRRFAPGIDLHHRAAVDHRGGEIGARSEERRVGKECVSKCRSRWWTYH